MPVLNSDEYEKNPYYLRPGETKAAYDARVSGSQKPSGSLQGTMAEAPKADRVSSMQNFSAAINKAVTLARNQRNDKSLDLVGNYIKPGSVSASSFTSLLGDINSASDRFTEPLVTDALSAASSDQKSLEDERNSIRDLALKLVESGAKNETVQGVLNAPNLDAAIGMAAGSLNALTKDADIRSVGRQLVRVDPATGKAEVIFTGASDSSGGSGGTGRFVSGALELDKSLIGMAAQELANARGEDGFTNTQLYSEAYTDWIDQGGLPQDFFKQYDPNYYLNPKDTTIPPYIRNSMEKPKESEVTNYFQ